MSLFRAATRLSRPAASAGRRRFGAQAEVEYEGFEKTVRTYLPKDEHIVFGILGLYTGLYFVGKGVSALSGGGAKEEAPKVAAVSASSGSKIPSVEDPNFGKWIESEANLGKLIASIEK
eukprot:CAMPEP_0182486952 /NCGR_PEP_ID=MMETSP1319-20130603/47655_1 /TAXON_ID=172717 /ORGANISM="Bolidomonas pacifica, Strain RCC208" /LENGTH=118 /DNA_ID=CAMNT_0024689059 /DNA_START=419 /DNA_END=775 /DNA_ORIENTATION=-